MGIDVRIGERSTRNMAAETVLAARHPRAKLRILRSNDLGASYLFWYRAEHALGLTTFFDRVLKRHPGTYRLRPADLIELETALRRLKTHGPLPIPNDETDAVPTTNRDFRRALQWLCSWTRWALEHAKRPSLANW